MPSPLISIGFSSYTFAIQNQIPTSTSYYLSQTHLCRFLSVSMSNKLHFIFLQAIFEQLGTHTHDGSIYTHIHINIHWYAVAIIFSMPDDFSHLLSIFDNRFWEFSICAFVWKVFSSSFCCMCCCSLTQQGQYMHRREYACKILWELMYFLVEPNSIILFD